MGYQLFKMCPFTVASIGGGGTIGGVGSEKYTWTHYHCLEKNCRLWTYKIDEKGEVYAEGCSLQFIGSDKNEINKNTEIKNELISKANRIARGDFCETCIHVKTKFFGFGDSTCMLTNKLVDKKYWCEKFKRQ